MNFREKIKLLEEWIQKSNKIVIFTGAGISTLSGIPDFRSPNGLSKKKSVIAPEEILSHHYFLSHPESFYQFLKKEMLYLNAKPNKAHFWIAHLEEEKEITVVTQNIDSLHWKAGSTRVLELHGNIRDYYCMKCGRKYEKDILKKELPICTCNGLIRPNIVLNQEPLDEEIFNEAIFAILKADMIIVMGSSLIVTPASNLLSFYSGNRFVIMNKEETPYDRKANLVFHEDILKVIKAIR